MPFPYDRYPWLNFQELNLAYFIKHFREIFQQWDQLYHDLTDWKEATDQDLADWKTATETGLESWKTGLTDSLETWKSQTASDISGWESATLAALDAWKTATTAVFEQIRTEAAGSASAAAASATDANIARAAAVNAQTAAEQAAAGISAELAQIQINSDNIENLKNASESTINSIVSKMELIDGKNLCRGDWSMTSGFVNVDGTTSENPAYAFTEYIPVAEGEIIGICNTQEGSFARRQMRFLAAFDADKNVISSAGATYRNSYTVPSNVHYVIITVTVGTDYFIYKNNIPSDYSPYDSYYIATRAFLPKTVKSYDAASAPLTDGSTLALPTRSAIKDGETIVFKCFITAFNTIRLNFFTNQITNYIEITNTEITVANKLNSVLTRAHGLTIINDFTLIVKFEEGIAYYSIYSNGALFEFYSEWEQLQASVSSLQIISTATVATSATLSATYAACKRKIWIFGDSYITLNSTARWAYYLRAPGYIKNALLSGASGGKSAISNVAFSALLAFGTPDYAVFATGMNDGSDGTSSPNATWVTQRDIFLTTCAEHSVEPIFCTIPTVPSVNNEQKNNWIRSSGYRYIDFAKAVGANANGEWYSGMLNTDNVHPSEYGARALYTQALIDLPEIMIPSA